MMPKSLWERQAIYRHLKQAKGMDAVEKISGLSMANICIACCIVYTIRTVTFGEIGHSDEERPVGQ